MPIFSGRYEGLALVRNRDISRRLAKATNLIAGFPGIVTKFYLRTRPLLKMFNCVYFYPVSEYRKVLQWVIDVSDSLYI